ncbi:hypothetical protein [Cerasicoccus fimbriatus]|uniref:hypothetical protein n=1 Tax=Cerasicoccus fimbriatus TaxID=3014554 RepID=UPI0022B4E0CA|nr:hypothetical protein [Cerasicoccus sp. TK19100]
MKQLLITGALCLLIGLMAGKLVGSLWNTAAEKSPTSVATESSTARAALPKDANSQALAAELAEARGLLAAAEERRDLLQVECDDLQRREALMLREPPGTSTKSFEGEAMEELTQRHQLQVKHNAMLEPIRDCIGLDKELALGVMSQVFFNFDDQQKQGIETALDNLWTQIRTYEVEHYEVVEETPKNFTVKVTANPELIETALARLRVDLRAAVGEEAANIMLPNVTEEAFRERWGVDRTITFRKFYLQGEKESAGWGYSVMRKSYTLGSGGFRHGEIPPQYQHLFSAE